MRILVIEDERRLAQLIQTGLQEQGYTADIAYSGEEGEKKAFESEYEAILLDLNLPDKDGLDVLEALREGSIDTPVLIVSARDMVQQRSIALDLGADDYIVKPFDFTELKARIRAVIRRTYGRATPQMKIGMLTFIPAQRRLLLADEEVELSSKEMDILEYIAFNHPNTVSAESIMEHIYGGEYDPNSSVLRVHFANIRRKFAKLTDQAIIETHKGRGYRFST